MNGDHIENTESLRAYNIGRLEAALLDENHLDKNQKMERSKKILNAHENRLEEIK